jgi:hypothetical protein
MCHHATPQHAANIESGTDGNEFKSNGHVFEADDQFRGFLWVAAQVVDHF